MIEEIKNSLWLQFGATIDMFENAVVACPESMWDDKSRFWYIAYHTLFFLDYYLDEEPDKFHPPEPFDLSEFDESGKMPPRVYNKLELTEYIYHCREKCRKLISELTEENLKERWINPYRNYSRFEILIYNMRHVQHHMAQMNLLLRQNVNDAPDWVSRTKVELN